MFVSKMFTWSISQVESFTLLEGRHLIEAMVVLGVFKAIKMDTLAEDDHVWELFGKFDFGFLKGDGRGGGWVLFCTFKDDVLTKYVCIFLQVINTWRTFGLAFCPFSLQSAASSSSDTVSSSKVLLLLKIASSLFNLFPLMRNLPFSSCTETVVTCRYAI